MKFVCHLILALFFTVSLLFSCHRSAGKRQSPAKTQTSATPETCIKSVIALDDSLGTVRNHACEKISLAETIRNYTDALQKLDFQGCPPAFAAAFEKHRRAWNDMIPLVKKYPDLRGEMHMLFDQLEKGEDAERFRLLLKNVWDTWGEVEQAMKND